MKTVKQLAEFIVTGVGVTSLFVWIARSSFGYASVNKANYSTGIQALMKTEMSWWSVAYIGVPVGLALFGLSKLLGLGKPFPFRTKE